MSQNQKQIQKYAKLIYQPQGSKKELDALIYYKGAGYSTIHNLLRNEQETIYPMLISEFLGEKQESLDYLLRKYYDKVLKFIYAIDRLFRKNRVLSKKQVVYRGIKRNNYQLRQMETLEKSGSILEKSYMSTSFNPLFSFTWVSPSYEVEEMMMLEFELPVGTPYLIVGWDVVNPTKEAIKHSEMELLLPRGCVLHLIEKKEKNYSFQITFENILKHKKYKILTYKCRIEYTGEPDVPSANEYMETVNFEATSTSDFSKIYLSP